MNDGGCDYERLGHFDCWLSTLLLILFCEFYALFFFLFVHSVCDWSFWFFPFDSRKSNGFQMFLEKSPFCVLSRPKCRFVASVTSDFCHSAMPVTSRSDIEMLQTILPLLTDNFFKTLNHFVVGFFFFWWFRFSRIIIIYKFFSLSFADSLPKIYES